MHRETTEDSKTFKIHRFELIAKSNQEVDWEKNCIYLHFCAKTKNLLIHTMHCIFSMHYLWQ